MMECPTCIDDFDPANCKTCRGTREVPDPAPAVGMPCTVCYATDRYAATVIAVSASGAKVTVQEDKSVRVDNNGMSESQRYLYTDDPTGRIHVVYRKADGTYGSRRGGITLSLGKRRTYHDYSF